MRELPPVDLAWIARAPVRLELSARFSAPPETVFAALADAASWPRWFPLMKKATYRDPAGGGIGREREVALRALGRFRERFLAWDGPTRYAFTAVATTSPMVKRFGEDYRLTADGSGTRFDWQMGAELRGPFKLAAPVLRTIMRRLLTRAARNLERRLSAS
jgi:carbon monoxide dehydrogenase subunit G